MRHVGHQQPQGVRRRSQRDMTSDLSVIRADGSKHPWLGRQAAQGMGPAMEAAYLARGKEPDNFVDLDPGEQPSALGDEGVELVLPVG